MDILQRLSRSKATKPSCSSSGGGRSTDLLDARSANVSIFKPDQTTKIDEVIASGNDADNDDDDNNTMKTFIHPSGSCSMDDDDDHSNSSSSSSSSIVVVTSSPSSSSKNNGCWVIKKGSIVTAKIEKPTATTKAGISLQKDEELDAILITSIAVKGPCFGSGLKLGQQVLSINGMPCPKDSGVTARLIAEASSGTLTIEAGELVREEEQGYSPSSSSSRGHQRLDEQRSSSRSGAPMTEVSTFPREYYDLANIGESFGSGEFIVFENEDDTEVEPEIEEKSTKNEENVLNKQRSANTPRYVGMATFAFAAMLFGAGALARTSLRRR